MRPLIAIALCVACAPDKSASSGTPGNGHPEGPPEQPCAECHPRHVNEWRMSSHAYAMRDPVFHAMVRMGQAETNGKMGQFCTKCHSPIGSEDGKTDVYQDDATSSYEQHTEGLDPLTMAGVSCEVCHSITSVKEVSNADFEMTRDGVRRATIETPIDSPAHDTAYSPLHADSKICGTCHEVINDLGVALERTMVEWVQSSFPGLKSCQDCHMPTYSDTAAVGGPTRQVHRHNFVGVDVSLVPPDDFPGYDDLRALSQTLLEQSAELTVTPVVAERALQVEIHNLAGHALPSGATADREMWLEVTIHNEAGDAVFESGTLDADGNLRVDDPALTSEPGTDPQLVVYTQQMYFDPALADATSTEPRRRVDFLWQPNVEERHLVSAGGRDTNRYDLTGLGPGLYTASVRLLFRSFAPHLLRKLEAEAGLDPAVESRVPTIEMNQATVNFELL